MQRKMQEMSELTMAQRHSQRTQLRAQDARSQIMLFLQHDPANSKIASMHDHPREFHFVSMDKAKEQLSQALVDLKLSLGNSELESAPLLTDFESKLSSFVVNGIDRARAKMSEGQYYEVNEILIKKINPGFTDLQKSSRVLNEYIEVASKRQIEKALRDTRRDSQIVLLIGSVVTALALFLSVWIARSIIAQLGGEPQEAIDFMEKVADGDLTVRVARDVPGSLLSSLNRLTIGLHDLIGKIHSQAADVAIGSSEIAKMSVDVSKAAEDGADATSSMAAAIEELTVSIDHLEGISRSAQEFANDARTLALNGQGQVRISAEEIDRVASDVRGASEKVVALDLSAAKISSIASVIKEIAGQTNLLALNAAIEAARAGETGRGFAVVADEVRKLAERTTSATEDIDAMISAVQCETQEIVVSMNNMLPQVERGTHSAHQASLSLEKISGASDQILQNSRDSLVAIKEQNEASTVIAQRVERLAQMIEETSVAMKNTSENAEKTGQSALVLRGMVESFKV
jgi:methyl-accepting chemotaxis protein